MSKQCRPRSEVKQEQSVKFNNMMSSIMRKLAYFICESKDADQLCGNRAADQRLGFHYRDNTIPLLSKFEVSSL